ncbi:MAG: hypothetical protein ACP5OA_05250 [Candidatus Woesearchaeota archaeon]
MENLIRLKFHTEKGPVELELPPRASLLKATLKVATNQQEVRREHSPDEYFEEREQMPKAFSKIKGFNKVYDRLKKQLGGFFGETWTIENLTKVEDNSSMQILDRKSLDLYCKELPEDINKRYVRAVVIHVHGELSNEDNAYIIDRISRDFNCTVLKYFTKEKLLVTKIDLLFFGADIAKKPPWMIF